MPAGASREPALDYSGVAREGGSQADRDVKGRRIDGAAAAEFGGGESFCEKCFWHTYVRTVPVQ